MSNQFLLKNLIVKENTFLYLYVTVQYVQLTQCCVILLRSLVEPVSIPVSIVLLKLFSSIYNHYHLLNWNIAYCSRTHSDVVVCS